MRDAIQKENVEIPGGTLEQGKWEVGLRTLGRVDATHQFNDIIIATVNGTPVRIADVGSAEDAVQKVTTSLFVGDHSPAVQLDIRRASGENTIRVTNAIKARLATIRPALPQGVTMTLNSDDSRFILASITSLEEHLLWGSLLAAAVVMFFIRNIRAVIISALAIPASIIATFTLMRAMDFTLNNMTLLGLTLAVGIVIDDAIVVLENIFRYIEEKGLHAVRGGHPGHPRGGAAGDGDDAVAGRDLPAGGVHDRLCAPVHLSIRLDDGVLDPDFNGRQLHADADAQLAIPEACRCRR